MFVCFCFCSTNQKSRAGQKSTKDLHMGGSARLPVRFREDLKEKIKVVTAEMKEMVEQGQG